MNKKIVSLLLAALMFCSILIVSPAAFAEELPAMALILILATPGLVHLICSFPYENAGAAVIPSLSMSACDISALL